MEFDQVNQIEEESVPGTGAEWVSADGHVGISDGGDILDHILNALEAALGARSFSIHIVTLLSGAIDNSLDKINDGHDK